MRVTVKNLALTCLSTIFRIHPEALLLYLDKNCAKTGANQQEKQRISDIFHFRDHNDPQLRGAVAILTSHFIKSVVSSSNGNFQEWIDEHCLTESGTFDIDLLLNFIYKVLILKFNQTHTG